MGLYCRESEVKIRLLGKVKFTDDPEDENRFQNQLLRKLIAEAESEVEHDLSPRYRIPLQCIGGGDNSFNQLPTRPTRNLLTTLCELKSVIRVLETDFGRGSSVNGKAYFDGQKERYEMLVDKQIEKEKGWRQWKYPPLNGLRLNFHNEEADDGYSGQVMVTGQGDGDFPQKQINDPSENFFNGQIDDPDNC